MSDLIQDFVKQEIQVESVIGIVVFGSFVKGEVRKTSDLDFLLVLEDVEEYSRIRKIKSGITMDIYRWPIKTFYKLFNGKLENLFMDAFCFSYCNELQFHKQFEPESGSPGCQFARITGNTQEIITVFYFIIYQISKTSGEVRSNKESKFVTGWNLNSH